MPRQLIRRAGAVVACFAVVGALSGWLWEWLWPTPSGVVVEGTWYPDPWDAGQRADFAGTGLYVTIALVAGLLLGAAVVAVSRLPELWTLATVVVGSVVAGLLMYAVGTALSPPDPQPLAAGLPDGSELPGALRLAPPGFGAFPLGSLIAVAVLYLTVSARPDELHSAEAVRR